jgi:hypothetical protein
MSMTWNSRADGWMLAAALAVVCGPALASDAPSPAIRQPAPQVLPRPKLVAETPVRVRIKAVSARAARPEEPTVAMMVSPSEREALRSPVLITVQVSEPFAVTPRDSSPVVVVNGRTIGDSFVPYGQRDRVVAVLRDGAALRGPIRVQVGWLGDFTRTLSDPVEAAVAP